MPLAAARGGSGTAGPPAPSTSGAPRTGISVTRVAHDASRHAATGSLTLAQLSEGVQRLRARIPHHDFHGKNGGVFVCWNASTAVGPDGQWGPLPDDVSLLAQLGLPVRRVLVITAYCSCHSERLHNSAPVVWQWQCTTAT